MNNILFSTTSQWNPGDEFIRDGILNVLRTGGLAFNPIIYNRNPVVNPWRAPSSRMSAEAELRENSFDVTNPVPVDYVVFAGTPEWSGGYRIDPLLKYIVTKGIRCSFVGIGLSTPASPSSLLRKVLADHTDVVLCRDALAFEMASRMFRAQMATCPSILCSKTQRLRPSPKCIGCVIQGSRMQWQRISPQHQKTLYACYEKLSSRYTVQFVAHYIDDLNYIPSPSIPVHYSGLSSDYYGIYDQFDLVVSPRLHGCGIAASLGIPSICLAHDGRGSAAHLFGSLVVTSPEGIDTLVEGHDWEARSERALDLKIKAEALYQSAIQPLLDRIRV